MHNLDDKHLTRLGFEAGTSEFRATTGLNKRFMSERRPFDIRSMLFFNSSANLYVNTLPKFQLKHAS